MAAGESSDGAGAVARAAGRVAAAVEELLAASCAPVSDEGLLDVVRSVECSRRRLESFDTALIGEIQARQLPGRLVVRSTARLLSGVLGISTTEASRRVRQADALGPRVTLTGDRLPAPLPVTAAARAGGVLTTEHVEVIRKALDRLPASLPIATHTQAEGVLVDAAGELDAGSLAQVARRLVDTLNPDGVLGDEREMQRRRFLGIRQLPDGMYRIAGDLDPATGLLAQTVLHALAAPKRDTDTDTDTKPHPDTGADTESGTDSDGDTESESESDGGTGTGKSGGTGDGGPDGADGDGDGAGSGTGGDAAGDGPGRAAGRRTGGQCRDERSAGQRLHDALRVACKKLLRAGQLPMTGGLPATILITMTAEQYETKTGLAATSFGGTLRVSEALRLADEAYIAWTVHGSTGRILAHGDTRRIATAYQTRALIARDQGCSFPGCTDPPEWAERHHITPWRDHGPTDVDNLCLICDYHHDRIDTEGWQITTQDGVPYYTPPHWIDPTQTPRRNTRPSLQPT